LDRKIKRLTRFNFLNIAMSGRERAISSAACRPLMQAVSKQSMIRRSSTINASIVDLVKPVSFDNRLQPASVFRKVDVGR
jgi:hypothetical protein